MSDLTHIITSVRTGDQHAYVEIVQRFQDMAIGYAHSLLGDAHLAEDAAQEAFVEAYVELHQLREAAAFPGWFRRIVHKRCDRLRRKRRLDVEPLEEQQWHLGTEPPRTLEEHEEHQQLQTAIQMLALEERTLITLFYLRQFTLAEIAAFLEMPETTANNRLHRARKNLRKELVAMAEQQSTTARRDGAFSGRVQKHIEALSMLHNALAPQLQAILSQALATDAGVRIASVTHTLAFKVIQWFPYPSCTYSFRPEGTQARIFFDVHMELAAAIVGRNIGVGDAIRAVDLGQLSQEEFPKIHPHAKQIMEQIVHLWDDTIAMEVIKPEIETSPVLTIADPTGKVADPEDPVFHVRFAVEWGDHQSYIDLCYPAPSLAAGLAHLQKATA